MVSMSLLVVSYVIVFALCCVYGATRSGNFLMNAGKHCVNISASLTAISKLDCCRACVEKDMCTMVSFEKSSKRCELSETDTGNMDAFVEEAGWDVYYKQNVGCLPGWVAYEDTCLYLDTVLRDKSSALSHCVSLESSAHLVDVKTEAKQLFLTEWLQQESPDNWLWLGGIYDIVNDQHYWSDGTPFGGYSLWWIGEPNGLTNELCIGAMHDANYYWFDVTCNYLMYGVCEYTLN